MADSFSAPGSSAGPATDVAPSPAPVPAPPVATVTAAPTPAPAPAPAPQPVQASPDDDLVTQAVDSQRLALSESLRQANATNPDKAAAIVKLAAQTRLHPTTASDIEGDLQATMAVQNADVDGLMQHHPEIAGWLLDRSNAQVSHDDLPSLRALDLMVRQATRTPDEDPLGILPKGYRFAGGRIVRPQGDNNEVIGDYRGLSEDLQASQNRDEREAVASSDRALRVGILADPFTTGVLGAFGGVLKAAKFLAGTSSADVSQSLDEITLASVEQHPGLGADAMRLAGGLVGDLPLLLSGGEVVRGATALTNLGRAGAEVDALTAARVKGVENSVRLSGERAAAQSTLSAAQAAGQFAGLNRILEPLLGKAGAEKAGERLLTAGAMAPVAAKIGLASAADKGPGYGAVDALINLAIPSAFGRVGVQRFLTPGLDQVGGNASVSAAGFLLKQAGLDATQNQAIELATAIHEHAAGDEHALDFDRLAPRLGMAGAAGGLMGGLFNLPEASRIKAARQGMQIRQSQAEADGLANALDAALASKTVQRSPDQAKQLVAEVIRSTGGSGDTVYAQGEAFRDHFAERGEDPAKAAEAMGVDPATYAASMASNSPLPIPLEGFLTRAREDDKPLLDHMTLRPDALTREQAGTATEALRKDIESQVAAQAKAVQQTTFKTERAGSAYIVHEDGTTTRTKVASAGVHEGDQGQKQRSTRTVYVAPEVADKLGSMYAQGAPKGKETKVEIGNDGTITLTRWTGVNKETGEAYGNRTVEQFKSSDKPAVGLHPVEEWKGAQHIGSKITEVAHGEPDAAASVSLDESSNRVGDVVEEQLLAAGSKPETAKYQSLVWAKGMRQLAERWNQGAAERGAKPMTPEDIFNRYQVKVSGPDAMRPEDIAREFNQEQATLIAPRGTSLEFGEMRRQWQKAHGERAVDTTSKEWNDLVQQSARVDAKSGKVYFQPAYHGSGTSEPFAKLDYSKVNGRGGEGTQNEGWGLYVTKEKQAARFYREQNSNLLGGGPSMQDKLRVYFKPGRIIKSYGGEDKVVSFNESKDGTWSVTVVPHDGRDGGPYIKRAEAHLAEAESGLQKDPSSSHFKDMVRRAKSDLARFERTHSTPPSQKALDEVMAKEAPEIVAREKANSGRLYEVDIPDDVHFLRWDQPFDKSPERVQEAVDEVIRKNGTQAQIEHFEKSKGLTGRDAYKQVEAILGSSKAASDALREAGVAGNKYRGDEESGHSNYVVFQDVPIRSYEQPGDNGQRGQINIGKDKSINIQLLAKADRSSFLHETGHAYLEILTDLAAHPDAAPSIKADLGTIREWLKSEEGKPWTVDQHEQFARGFERYLMEGKAPSIGLRRAFAAFARWLTSIYRDLVNLKVDLSPEVRRVFDKLLASDAEIAAAGAELHADPFFTDAKAAGMTPAEFARYQRDTAESKVRAADSTRAELMSFEKADARAERECAERDLTKAITADVNGRQDMLAIGALQNSDIPPGLRVPDGVKLKLDRAELVDRYGEEALKDLPGPAHADDDGVNAGRRLYAREGGMGIDEAAILFGYKDGDDLMTALVTAPDREALIATRVAKEMSALYPDPIHDADLASTAAAHLADELAGDVVGAEVRALEKQAGAPPTPRELIRQAAEKTVQGMRAYTLKPEVYRRAAEQASIKQFAKQVQLHEAKTPEQRAKVAAEVLAIAKERLTNLELFAAARRAKDASERNEAWIRQHDTLDARERMGKAGGWEFTCYSPMGDVAATVKTEREGLFYIKENPGSTFERTSSYLDQWDNIQEGFSLKRASNKALRRRESLRQFISRNTEDGEPVNIPDQVVEDLGKRRWTELTVAEQGAVNDGLRNVYSMALWKNKLLANKRKADLEVVATEVAAGIAQHATGTVAARVGTVGLEKAQNGIGGFLASATKDSFVARQMDGYQDGGVVWDTFILPRSEAATAKSLRQAEAAEIRAAALKAWDKSAGVTREAIPGTHLRLSREQRIGMAVYWGSREGRQRILADLDRQETPGTEGDVRAVLDSLDAADIALVEATWKQMGSYRPEIASLERRTTGMEPEWIQAVPFRIGEHTLPGGYCPIKYDITQGAKATNIDALTDAKSALRAANLAATTRRGFTKQRADQVQGRGLRYDFGVVAEGLNEVVHDLTHREMLQDQNRLFRNTTIAESIVKHYGKRTLDQLVNTTADIAQGEAPAKSAAERFARQLRKGVSAAAFGFNLTSALANVTGVTQAIPRVGVPRLLQALGHVTGSVGRTESAIAEMERRSPEMAMRSRTFMREVAEANATTGAKGTLDKIQRIGYWPMTQTQRVVDAITWHAGYDLGLHTARGKGLDGAEAEKLAIDIANQTVVDTQGSGRTGDMAAIMRGGEVSKFLTAFYTYFSTTYNLLNESAGRAIHKGEIGQMFGNAVALWALPAVLTDVIAGSLRGDSELLSAEKVARSEISYGLGMLVGFRELSGAVQGHGYSGPGSLGLINRAGQLIMQAQQGSVDAGLLKAASGVALSPFGLPAVEVGRLIDAWQAAAERGEYATALRTALFGKARSH